MACLPLTAGCVSSHIPSAFIFSLVEQIQLNAMQESMQEDRMHLLRGHTEPHVHSFPKISNFTLYTERPL